MVKTPSRLDFANSLRGLAALLVFFYHYVLVFGAIKGEYDGLSALPANPYPGWLINCLQFCRYIDLGALGVALFFLISGLVIPNSVAAFQHHRNGRIGFVIARFFRIWPTYCAGFAITMLALYLGAAYKQHVLPYAWEQFAVHVTLFRDWVGSVPIDGVVWTLEIEAKFYIFALLAWRGISRGNAFPLFVVALAALCSVRYAGAYPVSWNPPGNFLFALKYLTFMCIGVVFNYHQRGLMSLRRGAATATFLAVAFSGCLVLEHGLGQYGEVLTAYLVALALFSVLYFKKRDWTGGRMFRFLADVSYPLYVCHAALGYVGMRIMIDQGASGLEAFAVQCCVTISIAWMLHKFVENPTHLVGKKLAMKFLSSRADRVAIAQTAGTASTGGEG